MKSILKISLVSAFVLSGWTVTAQVQQKKTSETTQASKTENVSQVKAVNHNTTRSNRTNGQIAPNDTVPNGQEQKPEASSKKGYDYYKAKSDMKSTGAKNKAQDHNSSRSNKTASKNAPENNSGATEKRVNKVEAISVKQK